MTGPGHIPAHEHPADTAQLLARLRADGLTLATAESLTGGLVSALICDIPGASDVFVGAVVSYATRVKHDVLDVPQGPVISETTAAAMARGVAALLGTDCAVATTGVAGPDRQEGRPAGTVCLAALTPRRVSTTTLHLAGDRARVRRDAALAGLALLERTLDAPG